MMKKRTWIIAGAIIAVIICLLGMLKAIISPHSSSSGILFLLILLVAIITLIISFSSLIISTVKEHISAVKNGERNKLKTAFKVICLFGGFIDYLIIKICTGWNSFDSSDFTLMFLLIVPGIGSMLLYFLPYLHANKATHPQEHAIFILNLFAGWTIIAWIIALVWAFTEPKQRASIQQASVSNADELLKYKELLDSGVISQDEFDKKKEELLNT